MHALVQSYRELHREPRPTDAAEGRSAADLVDLCSRLLAAVTVQRRLVAAHLPIEDLAWPF